MVSLRLTWRFPIRLCGLIGNHDIGRMRRTASGAPRWWECLCGVRGGAVTH